MTVLISFTLIIRVKFVVHTSVFIQRLQEVHGGSRVPRSKIYEEEEEWHKTKNQATIPGTYQKSYVLLYRACSLYVDYICRACSLYDCVLYIVQCAKQPPVNSIMWILCCKYLRACDKYSHNWRQLKKSQGWWQKENVDHKKITQTVADICKFVMDSCMHVGRTFFNKESELARADKYEKIRN